MGEALWGKLKEVVFSVLPIAIIVLILHFTIAPIPLGILGLFLTGVVLLIIGMAMFTLGADIAMLPMGEMIGNALTEARKISLLVIFGFLAGLIITIAEPDLRILATQVAGIPDLTLIVVVGIGSGVFLVLGLLRILYNFSFSKLLWISYTIVFILAAFTKPDFLPVAFDSGGVTTGPITVPFILALGVGIAAVRGGKQTTGDSFGLTAVLSIGPIIAVFLLGMTFNASGGSYDISVPSEINNLSQLFSPFFIHIPEYLWEVGQVMLPLVGIFAIFQVFFLRLKTRQLLKMAVGLFYAYTGIVIFLTGANVGFIPTGQILGAAIASMSSNWMIIPIGFIMGVCVVAAEPAVFVLISEVEEVSGGSITRRAMMTFFCLGVGVSIAIAMLRVITGIDLMYFLLPGYIIGLTLTLLVPGTFTAIAFDSGGAASGAMTVTFLLPFAIGATEAVGGNIFTDAFGLVAMVAMTPLITIQLLGLIYHFKTKRMQTLSEEEEDMEENGIS
jgi:hypothetical protein